MGRELIVGWAGRRRRDDWEALCGGYRRRIRRMAPVREIAVKAPVSGARRLEAEGAALLEALPEPCWIVALDRKGRARSSSELAAWLARVLDDWPHPAAFLVGSDRGLSPAVLGAARTRLSLGPLTLPHALARLVLYEQLYRALCIRSGIKYHRGPL